MSFVFRGARADIENGFPGFIPERRALVCYTVCISYYKHQCVTIADKHDALLFLCYHS